MKKTKIKKAPRKTQIIDGQICSVRGIPLTRCSGTMTEAGFLGWILSALRSLTRKWKPAQQAWKLNTRPNTTGSRHKFEHQCAHCLQWFVKKKINKRSTIELDHIVPCGGLNHLDKASVWLSRAFVEIDGYQKLCLECHTKKSNEEKL